MGSVEIPSSSPYTPYDYSYRDCSSGVCSIYCPQYCYLIFPPPPPADDGAPFSPLIIAIIGVLASAFILVSYYTIVTRYCRRRRVVHSSNQENDENNHHTSHDQLQTGLDDAQIKIITVFKYRKGEGLIEGSECAVCLSEFQENESLRLLPKCDHAFHLPCVDTWLKSHSNCPLCRANAVPSPLPPVSSSSQINSYEIRRPDDLILVVDHQERNFDQEMVVFDGYESENMGSDQEGVEKFERSVSLGTFSCERRLLVSDILRIEEIDEDLQVKNVESSKRREKGVAMKRSVSSDDRFMFTCNGKGKTSVLPH